MEIKVELGLRAPTMFATSRVTGGEPGSAEPRLRIRR